MRQIVCISTSNYYPLPTRKQNVMNRLTDSEIMYVDPPVSLLAPLKDRKTFERIGAFRKTGEKVRDNITVFAPPPVLPFFNKYRSINRINQKMLARYIKKQIYKLAFDKPYLWCYSPTSCDLVKEIPNRGIIYDCVDRHSAYKGMIDPQIVDRMERDLAISASHIFCTARGLYDTLKKYNENVHLIPNGADYKLFSQAINYNKANPDKGKPVFGFIGMLQECIDYEWMVALAEAFPQGQVVLVGGTMPGVNLSPLKKYPNIKFMGLVDQKKLPEIIGGFDVCLNLFREGRLSKDVSPLKLYEYLATGKPVVSSREPLQVSDYKDVIYIAENKSDFVVKCRQALMEDDDQKVRRRMQYGKETSWSERVRQMEDILINRGIF